MDGRAFPDQEQLLQFLRRLKEVFDVCDEDADGFIRVEHLMDLGLQFGQGDEVTGWEGPCVHIHIAPLHPCSVFNKQWSVSQHFDIKIFSNKWRLTDPLCS